ncbi:spermatogenesis-associated protein 13-like isoform X5 [Argiope bruennichi]|nr:spermatogenesis-associated protein 13-like isoform X5 [Argiope bruennichi]
MGLGRNYILNEIDSSSNLSVLEEYLPATSDSKLMNNKVPVSMNKNKTPIVLRLQNKTSRSERYAKGRSASEIWNKNEQKSSSNKKRPSSQFYDIEEYDLKPENEPNLGQISNIVSSSQPSLCAVDQISNIPQPSSGLVNRHLPLHTSTPQLSPADSLLQRFRKSFAVRFKKKSESASNAGTPTSPKPSTDLVSNSEVPADSPKEKSTSNVQNNFLTVDQSQSKPANICDKKTSPSVRRRDLSLTYSTCRKRNKRKTDWRTSLFCDSVDSVFDTANKLGVDKCRMVSPHFTGIDPHILRKRTASTSDYSPQTNDLQRPVVVDCSITRNNGDSKTLDGKQDLRTPPDTVNPEDQQKNLTSLDQIWRANPVKLCRVHSRLLMCRHKGRYRLRRSISQPVELEMSGSLHNLRESTHGSADHDSFQKGSLSSEDEASSESDIYHSYCCSPTRRSNTCWELSADGTMYAEALWDHETLDSEELPFQAGDIIEVTDTSDQDWWWGTKDGQGGWFPSAFVRLYVSHRGPSLHFNGQQSDGIQIPYSPCKVSMNNLSCEQVRANIVQEIVATERDYVKHLKDVVEGYLKQVHRRPDMFSKERIETVFGNIKEIYTFQSQFLKELEECLDKESPHLSQIGNCFLNHKEEFKIYSQYCNNHPLAVSELQELYCDSQYIHFFEACRLLQEMIDISLDGFLLTPIQRICKYPLQLAELLKFTDENHPDHVPVSNALAAMKEVAELVNERKRRMECLERLAEWQSTIEGWEGPDVLDTSSVLIHCGEVTRVSSSWSRDIYLFLFDHQLIYCKKDLLKRHTYAYKGRLNLDHCDIVDIEDGKDSQFAVNVKNAWKIYCKDKEKWYLFYAKTFPEKEQWLRAFKAERQRVSDDEKQAFVVTEEAKRSARLAVHNKHKPKRPRAKFTKGRRCHPDVAVTELLLDSPNAKSRSGSLPSNIHPELAIMAGAKLGPTRKKGSGWFHFGSGKKPKS